MRPIRPWMKRIALLFGVFFVLLISLYLLRFPILRGIGGLLTHVDPIEPSEAIVVLSGAQETRPFYAARLYQEGIAPEVLITTEEPTPTAKLGLTPLDTDVSIGVLLRLGVPDSAVKRLSAHRPVTSTREEAAAIRLYVQEKGIRKLTVVTSPFHTARARYTLRTEMKGVPVEIRMAAAPEREFDPDRWWEDETGISNYGMEVLKWVYTLGVFR